MAFTHSLFLPFVFLTFVVWLPLGGRGRKAVLLGASLLFYASWSMWFLAVLAFVWSVVWLVPPAIAAAVAQRTRKRYVVLGLALLLGPLAALKYSGAVGAVLSDSHVSMHLTNVVLPIGMSFYVFQSASYLIDVYRGQLIPSTSILDTALYVSFFPLILAGPIERGRRWMPEIQAFHPFRLTQLQDASERLILGYLLKMGVADPVGVAVNGVLDRAGAAGSGVLLATMFLYSLQILADFAGYSLIARGVACLFGYDVQRNFEQPYLSRTFSEFWRRWHISLSSWLQEYLFMPLFQRSLKLLERFQSLGEDGALYVAYAGAAVITMAIAGLWHGVGFTFLLWGMFHGIALGIERSLVFRKRPIPKQMSFHHVGTAVRGLLSAALVFLLVSVSWVLFRADSLPAAYMWYRGIIVGSDWTIPMSLVNLIVFGYAVVMLAEIVQYIRRDEWVFRSLPWSVRPAVLAAIVVHCVLYSSRSGNMPFVYARF